MLAVPFSKHICEHLLIEDKQITSRSSSFLDECRKFNRGEISAESLYETTESLGFVNVIDAFHRVGPTIYLGDFLLMKEKGIRGIVLTPEIHEIASKSGNELDSEVESFAWRD